MLNLKISNLRTKLSGKKITASSKNLVGRNFWDHENEPAQWRASFKNSDKLGKSLLRFYSPPVVLKQSHEKVCSSYTARISLLQVLTIVFCLNHGIL